MAQTSQQPVRRRLDIKAMTPAGEGPEFLTESLVDPDDQDHFDAQGVCTLPAPDMPLGDSGITVDDFLSHWRGGHSCLDGVARAYGRALYRHLLAQDHEIHHAWQGAVENARQRGCGMRLEIRCPLDSASRWMGQPPSALPFELMCDDRGYLFRRPGWSTARGVSRGLASRSLRPTANGERPRVQVAWANVRRPSEPAMNDTLFTAHDVAVQQLETQGSIERLPPCPLATARRWPRRWPPRPAARFVWIGHGLASGSGLLLHDGDSTDYPADAGSIVAASDFAAAVRAGEVDVALLWSCHGAGTFRPLDVGVAEALLDPDRGNVAAGAGIIRGPGCERRVEALATLDRRVGPRRQRSGGCAGASTRRARRVEPHLGPAGALPGATPLRRRRQRHSCPACKHRCQQPGLSAGCAGCRSCRRAPVTTYITIIAWNAWTRTSLSTPSWCSRGWPVPVTELALAMAHRRRTAGEDVAFIDLSGQRNLAHLRQTLGLLVAQEPFDDDAGCSLHWRSQQGASARQRRGRPARQATLPICSLCWLAAWHRAGFRAT